MSKTLFVEFRGRGFWAYDVISGVFLKHLIDTASRGLGDGSQPWLVGAIANWRVSAVISDLGFFLDDDWSDQQIKTFTALAEKACKELSRRCEIPADEIASWPILDDLKIFPRGLPAVGTQSPIRLGQAVIQLVNGSLPEPPAGTWWFFGTEDAPRTLTKRES